MVPKRQLPLGLDLRGGAHLLLAMDTNELKKDWLTTLRDDARKQLREAKIGFSGLGIAGNSVQVKVSKPEDTGQGLRRLEEAHPADRQRHPRHRRQRHRRSSRRRPT